MTISCPILRQPNLVWSQRAVLPVEMSSLQSIVIGGKVYVGGGTTYNRGDLYQLFSYKPIADEWSALPLCPVAWFALCEFQERLVTVGGFKRGHDITGELYCYTELSRSWEAYLKPMPTPRALLTAITTHSAIAACGGVADPKVFQTVEVYKVETEQWHIAEPLPSPWTLMTSVCIDDTCYLLGGKISGEATNMAVSTSLTSLTKSPLDQQSANTGSLWKSLPYTPLKFSSAANLEGSLLAVGGSGLSQASSDVHMFCHETNSWIRIGEKIPAGVYATTVVTMADGRLLVFGGLDNEDRVVDSVYSGTQA